MLNANIRIKKTEKKNLTSEYYFEGIKICMLAFLTIYGIGKKKWEVIRKHFNEHDITPIVHGLTGRKSNNAISFEAILQILTFVTNYANINGLPSLARCFFIKIFMTFVTYFFSIFLIN